MLPGSSSEGVQEFKARTEYKLNGIRCPEHHQRPRLRFSGTTLQNVSIQMSGCCDRLLELANRAIAEKSTG